MILFILWTVLFTTYNELGELKGNLAFTETFGVMYTNIRCISIPQTKYLFSVTLAYRLFVF